MKPPPFLYAAPESLEETLVLLNQHGADAKLLAGGQSLMPLLNMRLARPAVVIDLNRVRALDHITASDGAGGEVRIGAMTRQRSAERSAHISSQLPLFAEALRWVGHPQIRNRGTVGGSLAHADPAAELPAVAAALGAKFMIAGLKRTREVTSDEFFVGYLTTAIVPDEVLTEIRVPAMARGAGWGFAEVSRRHGDFALVGAAAVVHVDGAGVCRDVRVTFTGVGPTPIRVREAEAALEGQWLSSDGKGAANARPQDGVLDEVARLVAARLEPESDIHASSEYRRHVAGVMARRALIAAAGRIGGAESGSSGMVEV